MTLHFSPDETEFTSRSIGKDASSAAADLAGSVLMRCPKESSGKTLYRRGVKRSLDVSLALLTAPLVVPLILIMAIVIMIDGHNPFYSQMRVGRHGRIFRMWKLRTMVHDAEARLEDHLSEDPAARLEWDTTQKLKNDPRITLIGRVLRKTSLDELPQLWNVLIGDMSLVGPRPMMSSQRESYTGLSYYNLRPGITGLWQISDRNNCEFVERVRYDNLYDRIVSLRTDLAVIVRTVGVVLRGTGY
jgi:exopolysaccharide production protein ExoY